MAKKKQQEKVQIDYIRIADLGNIQEEEWEPGLRNIRTGKNRSGKTSGLDALRAAFRAGDNQDLIRRGSAEGLVTVGLTNNLLITRKFRKGKRPHFTLTVNDMEVKTPQSVLDEIQDSFAIDPLGWVTAKEKEREAALLNAIPMEVTEDQLTEIFRPLELESKIPTIGKRHALVVLKEAHRVIYDERTGINKLAKNHRENMRSLREALPPDPPATVEKKTWAGIVEELEEKGRELSAQISAVHDRLKREWAEEDADFTHQVRSGVSERVSQLEAEIKKFADAEGAVISLVGISSLDPEIARTTEAQAQLDVARTEKLAAEKKELEAEAEKIQKELNEAETYSDRQGQVDRTKERIAENEKEAKEYEDYSGQLTAGLDAIIALRRSFLSDSPIEGLEVIEDRLCVDGVPLEKVNTERRIQMAFDIASLRMGDLRVCFMDNLEALDEEHREFLFTEAEKRNIQVFGAMVSDGELKTVTEGELS